jgi:hypothetical protein
MLRWNGATRNRVAAAGLAVLLLGRMVGCGKSATPAPTTAGPGAAAGSGPGVPGAKLAAIDPPDPHGAPPKGSWHDARPIEDGDRSANYETGDVGWVGIYFLDCNLPKVKEAAQKAGFLRAHLRRRPDGEDQRLSALQHLRHRPHGEGGPLLIMTVIAGTAMGKLTVKDLEAFLASIDLAATVAL